MLPAERQRRLTSILQVGAQRRRSRPPRLRRTADAAPAWAVRQRPAIRRAGRSVAAAKMAWPQGWKGLAGRREVLLALAAFEEAPEREADPRGPLLSWVAARPVAAPCQQVAKFVALATGLVPPLAALPWQASFPTVVLLPSDASAAAPCPAVASLPAAAAFPAPAPCLAAGASPAAAPPAADAPYAVAPLLVADMSPVVVYPGVALWCVATAVAASPAVGAFPAAACRGALDLRELHH